MSPIGTKIKEKLSDNEDFRDGFIQAIIMMRLEDDIIETGRDKMEEIFQQVEEVQGQ